MTTPYHVQWTTPCTTQYKCMTPQLTEWVGFHLQPFSHTLFHHKVEKMSVSVRQSTAHMYIFMDEDKIVHVTLYKSRMYEYSRLASSPGSPPPLCFSSRLHVFQGKGQGTRLQGKHPQHIRTRWATTVPIRTNLNNKEMGVQYTQIILSTLFSFYPGGTPEILKSCNKLSPVQHTKGVMKYSPSCSSYQHRLFSEFLQSLWGPRSP